MPLSRIARVSQEGVKANEVRAVATSLQLINKVDLQAVMKAGKWSSGGTFTSFYLQDVCLQADSTGYTEDRTGRSRRRDPGDLLLGWLSYCIFC